MTLILRTPTNRRGAATGGGGFTLLEVLVALVLFGAGVAILVDLANRSLRLAAGARDLGAAQTYASQRMEEALHAPKPAPGVESGPFGERYRWELETTLASPEEGNKFREVRFRVTVRWDDGASERSLELTASRWMKETELEAS